LKIPRILLLGALSLFAVIGVVAVGKRAFFSPKKNVVVAGAKPIPVAKPIPKVLATQTPVATQPDGDFPIVNRIQQLFSTTGSKLPIVETISYASNVAWLKGRPAWIGDYAAHYSTSRHFIARSLNGKPDYFTQKVGVGSKFNVFRKDRNIQFHLLVDLSRAKMAFYYIDLDTSERVLLKTYQVGIGKITPKGSLTPLGKFTLGDKIAVYRPGIMGLFQDKQTEMIRVFGTRWIPLLTPNTTGYGIQGAPWEPDSKTGQYIEARQVIGKTESNGCIQMAHEDLEELFSIVITKPATIEIVQQFKDAKLPGIEVTTPTR